MNSQMKLAQEQENLYTNVEELDNTKLNSELFKSEHLENTPFTMIENEDGHFGVIGEHRISEYHKTKEELKKDLEKISWNRIVQVLWAITNKINKININE